ncbi:MAG: hypothetical protein F4003_11065 [Acidimicrobiaceae bacterium]|nr:hypothetical protein [Acidimicrobiaceae bacterium]MYC43889.1 hypothetical protein [Acidimicrobiaceae bacterium]MYD08061.1 hypothetical protein [Acidimicrobiaceae bacterium]
MGDFGVTMGSRTVTIPASVSATVTVQMSDDSVLLKRTDRWPWTCRAVPATERRFLGGQVWLCPMMTVTGAIIDND